METKQQTETTGNCLITSGLMNGVQAQALMWERYGAYLTQLRDEEYRDHVFDYIVQEDSPRLLMFQLDLLRSVGFSQVELLHKNSCFATFGAIK